MSRPSPIAGRVMEPLRAALGGRQRVGAAHRSLERHGARLAPVILAGCPIGLVSRERLEQAQRFGLGDELLARLITGECPQVGPGAAGEALRARSRGTAPGILVRAGGGTILGVIDRARLTRPRGAPAALQPDGLLAHLSGGHQRSLAAARRVAARLHVPVYLVGGAVRDLLLGRPVASLDLAVVGDGIEFAASLAGALGARMAPHRRFGTAVLTLREGRALDVVTARRETYQKPAALPVITPAAIDADLLRRDLTINAMAIRIDGRDRGALLDPLHGARDLRHGTLRVLHRLSMSEDPTRAFRAARMAARLGMRWHAETQRSLQLARSIDAFARLSPQRRFREFMLTTLEPDPSKALAGLRAAGVLVELLPRIPTDGRRLAWWRRLTRGEPCLDATARAGSTRALLYLGLLLIGTPRRDAVAALAHLGITGAPARGLLSLPARVAALQRTLCRAKHPPRPSRVARLIDAADADARLAAWCCSEPRARRFIDTYLRRWRTMRPEVTGADLRRLGIPPGPVYGAILKRLREARLDGAFAGLPRRAGREAELCIAARLARLT